MASFKNMKYKKYIDSKKIPTRLMINNEKTNKWSSWMMLQDHYVINLLAM